MRPSAHRRILATTAFAALAAGATACRTHHTVETTHKIDAHIVLEIRNQARQIESEVREGNGPAPTPPPEARIAPTFAPRQVASLSLAGLWSAQVERAQDEQEAIERRKARAPKLNEELAKGCLGENNLGRVVTRDCPDLRDAEQRARINELAADENRDRRQIYLAVARRAGLKEDQVDEVGKIFAAEHRASLRRGMQFQVPQDEAHYADFLKSPLGEKLDKPPKGAWVKVP